MGRPGCPQASTGWRTGVAATLARIPCMRPAHAALAARCFALALGLGMLAPGANAQQQRFPAGPITLIAGAAAGGGLDTNARLLAAGLASRFGQPVIVENRPGAGSRIANQRVARAPPDGRTLLLATAAMTIDMAFQEQRGFDTLRELAPIATIATTPMIAVVNAAWPVTDLRTLIERARAAPGALNYASSGPGTTGHLYGELFKVRTGTDIVHIPYQGTAPALAALLAGEVEMSFATLPGVLQHVRAGKLRALATTGATRSEMMPGVPTMREAGVENMEASVWYGVFAPAGTPPAIVETLARAIDDVARTPSFVRQLADLGEEPAVVPTDRFAALLRVEVERWAGVVKAARMQATE